MMQVGRLLAGSVLVMNLACAEAGVVRLSDELAMVNVATFAFSYPGSQPLLGTIKDGAAIKNELGGVVISEDMLSTTTRAAFQEMSMFSQTSCNGRKEARLLWFSGHAQNPQSSINEKQVPASYALVLPDRKNYLIFDFYRLLSELAASDCMYVVGLDAIPSSLPIRLPRNVAVIWADIYGGAAFDDREKGGYLTQSFVAAMKKSRTWSVDALTQFLRSDIKERLTSDKKQPILWRGMTKTFLEPWVQVGDPQRESLQFPSGETEQPKYIPFSVGEVSGDRGAAR